MRINPTPKLFMTVLLTATLATCASIVGAWVSVGNGIEYQSFTASGPNNVFVCRMSRTSTSATLESTVANGKLTGGRQVTSAQGALLDESISWWCQDWGARNDVVCAINGAYETEVSLHPDGQQIQSGWYAKRISEWGWSGFGWTVDRIPFIGACVHTRPDMNYITEVSTGYQFQFDNVNAARGTNNTIIYTPQYDASTLTDSTGVEFVVKMDRPTLILPSPAMAEGTVTQIRVNQGSTPIPWDCIVISATGSKATLLQSNLSVGDRIGITQYFLEYEADCGTPKTNKWTKTFASIGGNVTFLKNGTVVHNYQAGMVARNPRTCICYNADYVYYVVCDGRTTASVGWTNDEMAAFCLNTLGATDGINEDGGGSSVMVVNGKIMNSPSDGSERSVVNGIAMVNVSPRLQSTTFTAGQSVTVNASTTYVRLGPGTNYASISTKNANATGTIVGDWLNGVYAKGFFWWKVDFSDVVGWVHEPRLISTSTGPTIVQQPQSRTSCAGNSVKFEVVANGKGSLSYRWQKNSVNLSNAGHYSGVLTPKLIISTIDSTDYASYRCVVTDTTSSATSSAATLSQGSAPAAPTAQAATNIGADTITWNWSAVPDAQGYKLWTAASGGTQIGGLIYGNFYTETGMGPGTSYTRYVEAWSCGASATRTPLGPTSTLARNCPENADFESGFTGGIGNHWVKMADDGTSVVSQETTIIHGGTSSQRIEDPMGGQGYTGWIYQKVNVVPARQYVLRYYHYHTGTSGQTTGFVTGLGCDVNGGTSFASIGESMGPLGEWLYKKSSPFTSGAGGLITIGFRGGYNNGGTVGYADDFSLAPAPPTASAGAATIGVGQSSTISASGGFGGSASELHWYTGANGTGTHAGTGTSLGVSPTTTTAYYPRWESAANCGGCCVSDDGPSVTVTAIPPPSAVAVTDEGNYTPSLDTLKASWTDSIPSGGSISRYEYSVGTSSGTQDVKAWTSNGMATSATITGLSLTEGTTYYVQARAVDSFGNASPGSSANGILAAPGATPIAAAWNKANDTEPLSLRNKIVTAALGGAFWLEETDRTMGIKVVSGASVARGNTVSVAGVLGLSGSTRALFGDVVINSGGTTTILPLATTEKYLGGSAFNPSTPGITGGRGLYNIGLFVKVFGNVTYSNTDNPADKYFFIDDGSGLSRDGHAGVLVRCGSVTPPASGMRLVTGIAASEQTGAVVVPVILIRDAADIASP